jgi:hypothetical protein
MLSRVVCTSRVMSYLMRRYSPSISLTPKLVPVLELRYFFFIPLPKVIVLEIEFADDSMIDMPINPIATNLVCPAAASEKNPSQNSA